MSATAERVAPHELSTGHTPEPSLEATPFDPDAVATNPVARAHARARLRPEPPEARPTLRVAGSAVIVLTIFALVSNPLGWILLFLICIGFAVLFAFGGIL